MKKENNSSKKIFWDCIAALGLTFSGIGVLMSGLQDGNKPTVIVAGFILLLDLITIVAFLVDFFRKR